MYGRIPDARNAVFDIWRTYEDDFTVSDVSFYLKLNHSRLITSTLRWRPELKADIIVRNHFSHYPFSFKFRFKIDEFSKKTKKENKCMCS